MPSGLVPRLLLPWLRGEAIASAAAMAACMMGWGGGGGKAGWWVEPRQA